MKQDAKTTEKKNDREAIREDFPILNQKINGRPLIYLDNASSSQKPRAVIDAIRNHYTYNNANVHRGIHELSNRSTEIYEGSRKRVAEYLNAANTKEIIFTRGTTESINLVAQSWGQSNLNAGDTILLTEMEHHSNLVPWQILAKRIGAKLEFIPVTGDNGLLDLSDIDARLDRAKLLSFTHFSNTMGTINPAKELCQMARKAGVVSLVDAAQSAGHTLIDVQEIDCDFLAFSGHKICGPTGIGVLYGRKEKLEEMPPYQGGGEMISKVEYFESTFNEIPHKFEAGTPNIAGAAGLYAAIEYIDNIGRMAIFQHDQLLVSRTLKRLKEIDGIRIFGPDSNRSAVVSFVIPDTHALDLATMADQKGVAIRAGHHCNQPLLAKLGVQATARASFNFYNTESEVDRFIEVIHQVRKMFV